MKDFKFADHIESKEDITNYLKEFFISDGVDGLIDALGYLAKKHGMTKIADKTGLNRQNLYRSLKKGANPDFKTVNKVINALDCRLEVR